MHSTLDPEPNPSHSASSNLPGGACPFCGSALANPNACDRCDWVREGHAQMRMRHDPRDTFACLMSLFWPGLGHFYKGHTMIAVVLACLGVLCFFWSLAFLMFFGFLCLPAYWIAVAASAFFLPDLKHHAQHAHASGGMVP